MALYDTSIVEFMGKTLTTTATDSVTTSIPVGSVGTVSQITFKLQESNTTTKRIVYVYKNGTGVSNEEYKLVLDPATSWGYDMTQLTIVLQAGQVLSFKQDAGADVNVYVFGIVEQVV